jgi:hypothetical protein
MAATQDWMALATPDPEWEQVCTTVFVNVVDGESCHPASYCHDLGHGSTVCEYSVTLGEVARFPVWLASPSSTLPIDF